MREGNAVSGFLAHNDVAVDGHAPHVLADAHASLLRVRADGGAFIVRQPDDQAARARSAFYFARTGHRASARCVNAHRRGCNGEAWKVPLAEIGNVPTDENESFCAY